MRSKRQKLIATLMVMTAGTLTFSLSSCVGLAIDFVTEQVSNLNDQADDQSGWDRFLNDVEDWWDKVF